MADERAVGFSELATADLVLERIYKGGSAGHAGDGPLGRLLPGVGNQGGFRPPGPLKDSVKLVVLYTSGAEPDWPDALDPHTGTFTYFIDNRSPGRDLHDTPRRGNQLLRDVFERAAAGPAGRAQVPPFFLFDKPGTGRDVRFRGLLAPGSGLLGSGEDLIAIWRTARGQRFQNYRARFTVLDVHTVPRSWIEQLRAGEPVGGHCPPTWRTWVQAGTYTPLLAPSTVKIRSREEQQPAKADMPLLERVCVHFGGRSDEFEYFAADLWRMSEPKVDKIDVTRPWRDGGRDAVGEYLIGPAAAR